LFAMLCECLFMKAASSCCPFCTSLCGECGITSASHWGQGAPPSLTPPPLHTHPLGCRPPPLVCCPGAQGFSWSVPAALALRGALACVCCATTVLTDGTCTSQFGPMGSSKYTKMLDYRSVVGRCALPGLALAHVTDAHNVHLQPPTGCPCMSPPCVSRPPPCAAFAWGMKAGAPTWPGVEMGGALDHAATCCVYVKVLALVV
jgi:hypothetical protein